MAVMLEAVGGRGGGRRVRPQRGGDERHAGAGDVFTRVPPSDLVAEQSLLGAILLLGSGPRFEKLMAAISDNLPVEDFYRETHRNIYAAMLELWQEQTPVDVVTLLDRLKEHPEIDAAYIAEIASVVPTAEHVGSYVRIIREKASLRIIAAEASALAGMAYDATETPLKLIERADGIFGSIQARTRAEKAIPSLQDNISQAVTSLLTSDRQTVSSGFESIDRVLQGGFKRGHLVVLGARTSKGKSALSFNFATRVARGGTVVITLEMPAAELLQRAVLEFADVDLSQVRFEKRALWDSEAERLQYAADRLAGLNLEVIYEPKITPRQARALIRAASNKWDGKLDLVIVDYLQRMRPDRPEERRDLEIAQITDTMKTMAGELDCPVVLLAQLTRESVKRENPMPMLSDLRESGAIEQDADEVLFIWDTPPKKNESIDYSQPRTMHLSIAKQRNGPVGTVDLRYEPKLTKFSDLGRYGG